MMRIICVVLGVLALGTVCLGDEVVLNDGRTLTGAIQSETSVEIVIRTTVGTLRVPRRDIREIRRDGTTEDELNGDKAQNRGELVEALRLYRQAAAAGAEPAAATRLNEKIARIEATLLQQAQARLGDALRNAETAMAARNYDAAIQGFAAVRNQVAQDEQLSATVSRRLAEAHVARSQFFRDRQDERSMNADLQAAIEADATLSKPYLLLGERKIRTTFTANEGIELIRRGLALGAADLPATEQAKYYYLLGQRLFELERFEDAAAAFTECVAARPQGYGAYEDALDRAVESYVRLGERNMMSDFQSTINNLDKALELNPGNTKARFLLGRMYRDAGETSSAVEAFRRVIEIEPTYRRAHLLLGQSYLDMADYQEAVKAFDTELRIDPQNYDALVDRAAAYIEMKQYDKADDDVKTAQALEPSKYQAFLLAAQLDYAQERFDEARTNLARVLQLKPDAIEAYIQMGKVLAAGKDFENAAKWFEEVVNSMKDAANLSFRYRTYMAEAQTALGEIDLDQNNPRSAEGRFEEALTFLPNFARAYNKIGDVRLRLASELSDAVAQDQAFRAAEDFYRKAIDANPQQADYYLSLAVLYHRNFKDTDRALVNYRKYLDLGGQDRINVNKWIQEATTASADDDATTPTEALDASGETTGTEPAAAAPAPAPEASGSAEAGAAGFAAALEAQQAATTTPADEPTTEPATTP